MDSLKPYSGRVPACGVFCGGCPVYLRDKKPCPGAEQNRQRCQGCKTFHLCCQARGITYCHQCSAFPCRRFRDFAKRWLKYGQDFVANQRLLQEQGPDGFLRHYNALIKVPPSDNPYENRG